MAGINAINGVWPDSLRWGSKQLDLHGIISELNSVQAMLQSVINKGQGSKISALWDCEEILRGDLVSLLWDMLNGLSDGEWNGQKSMNRDRGRKRELDRQLDTRVQVLKLEHMLDTAVELSDNWMIRLSNSFEISHSNIPFSKLLGYRWEELNWKNLADLLDDRSVLAEIANGVEEVEVGLVSKQGVVKRFILHIINDKGSFGYLCILKNINEEERSQIELRKQKLINYHLANHSQETWLPNAARFEKEVYWAVDKAKKNGAPLTMAIIKLNKSWDSNDRTLSSFLSRTGMILSESVRREDKIAHLWDCRFGIIFEQWTNYQEVIWRIVRRFVRPIDLWNDNQVEVWVDYWIAEYNPATQSIHDDVWEIFHLLMKNANNALERAKVDF